jgi:hypothetical protein
MILVCFEVPEINYTDLRLCSSSGILKSREHNVSEAGCASILR